MKRILGGIAVCGGILLASPAHALVKWTLSGCTSTAAFGNSCTYAGFDTSTNAFVTNVTATAWSNTGAGPSLETAAVLQWDGGVGVGNQNEGLNPGSPQHSADNDTSLDLVMFEFDDAVALSSVGLGWYQTDSDISVLRWANADVAPTVAGVSYSTTAEGLTGANAWELIGNYDVDFGDTTVIYRQGLGTTQSSSYWLVAAYNTAFGDCAAGAGTCQLSPYNDYVKIKELKGAFDPGTPGDPPTGVPEPASLALLLAAFAPVAWRRRRMLAHATA